MTVAQIEPLSDEGGIDHTPKTSHPRASGDYLTATPFDLEVYADRYSEMLETRELEYRCWPFVGRDGEAADDDETGEPAPVGFTGGFGAGETDDVGAAVGEPAL